MYFGKVKYLIVGLGNIGDTYVGTRHNVGFDCLDYIAGQRKLEFKPERFGQYAETRFRGRKLCLLKPDTFMNLSGHAVAFWVKKLRIPLNHLIVITDDLNLDFGLIRLKPKGGNGGHNGLKSIEEVLGTQEYPRIRIGISSEFTPGKQVDYVLSAWNAGEPEILPKLFHRIQKGIEEFAFRGIGLAMTSLNAKE